jgi:hypothetical protein
LDVQAAKVVGGVKAHRALFTEISSLCEPQPFVPERQVLNAKRRDSPPDSVHSHLNSRRIRGDNQLSLDLCVFCDVVGR